MSNRHARASEWGDRAPEGMPTEVIFCDTCVISNQKPITAIESHHRHDMSRSTVRFVNGKCDACRWAWHKEHSIDWGAREAELEELCNKHRSTTGEFDVVVPASGGKDSCYVSHILKSKYRMNPLTVTWRPNQFTDVGLQNLFRLIDAGLPNVMISPPGDVHRRLTYMAFRELGHPFQPFIAGQRVVGPRIALNNRIKLIFYGENVAEYGNRLEENFTPRMQPELYTCFDFDQLSLDRYRLAGKTLKELIQSFGFSLRDFQSYKSPTREEVEKAGLEVHYMSYYRKWVPQENYYYAVENVGFSQSEQRKDGSYSKYSGIDDYLEDLHYYMQYIKFGMGRCTWDASQEIRSGRLERDEAVTLVKRYDGEPPRQSLPHILSYLRISEAEFWEIVNSFRSRNLFFSDDNGDYHLRKEIS